MIFTPEAAPPFDTQGEDGTQTEVETQPGDPG
jgi:hypothetical protein